MPKRLLFTFAALALLAVGTEVVARVVLFQLHGRTWTAVQALFEEGQAEVDALRVNREVARVKDLPALFHAAQEHLDDMAEGRALRARLRETYAQGFAKLAQSVAAVGSKLVVVNFLALPGTPYGRFFAHLAQQHNVDYLDVSKAFAALPQEQTMLRPIDSHLTRFGNAFLAREIAEYLERYRGYRSGRDYDGTPARVAECDTDLGRQLRHGRALVSWNPELGFCIRIDAQGFRNDRDVEIPKRRQRVACLGDSYTFGPHINNLDTYPSQLGRRCPDLEVLNAGVCGTTITDQAELFADRTGHVAPDITILQVCTNDLVDLMAMCRNEFARSGRGSYVPDDPERAFVAALRDRIAKARDSSGARSK